MRAVVEYCSTVYTVQTTVYSVVSTVNVNYITLSRVRSGLSIKTRVDTVIASVAKQSVLIDVGCHCNTSPVTVTPVTGCTVTVNLCVL